MTCDNVFSQKTLISSEIRRKRKKSFCSTWTTRTSFLAPTYMKGLGISSLHRDSKTEPIVRKSAVKILKRAIDNKILNVMARRRKTMCCMPLLTRKFKTIVRNTGLVRSSIERFRSKVNEDIFRISDNISEEFALVQFYHFGYALELEASRVKRTRNHLRFGCVIKEQRPGSIGKTYELVLLETITSLL